MSKKSFIDSIGVGSPCTADWDKMFGNDMVRMCEHCSKDVNNLSEFTRKDAKRLVRASGSNICIRYMQHPVTKRPIFAEQMYQITRRAPGIAAGVVTASISLSTMAYPQGGASLPLKSRDARELTTLVPGSKDTENTKSATKVPGEETVENKIDNPREILSFGGMIAVSRDYATPLARAVDSDDIDQVRDLITRDENVNGKDKNYDDLTPLFLAVENGNIEIAQLLLNAGARVNVRDRNKQTALMRLDIDAKPEMIDLLVRHGVKLNLSDNEGNTAILLAAAGVSSEVLRTLIEAGAEVNLANKEGETPLMRAAESGHLENVRILLESGARVNARDNDGQNAWDYADGEEIEKLLEMYGSEVPPEEPEETPDDDPKVVITFR